MSNVYLVYTNNKESVLGVARNTDASYRVVIQHFQQTMSKLNENLQNFFKWDETVAENGDILISMQMYTGLSNIEKATEVECCRIVKTELV